MRMFFRLSILTLFLFAGLVIKAETPEFIRNLIVDGEASRALELAKEELAKKPKTTLAGELNMVAGIAAEELGLTSEAMKYFNEGMLKGNQEAALRLADLKCAEYDFKGGADIYAKQMAAISKAGHKPAPELLATYKRALNAQEYLLNVEALIIIDSIRVNEKNFYTYYKLPRSAGSLIGLDKLPKGFSKPTGIEAPIYLNESADMMLFSAPYTHKKVDAAGDTIEENYSTLWSADLLSDGTWSLSAHPELCPGNDIFTPYMLSDGQTLYYSTWDEDGIGGTDLMVSSRDPSTGLYRTGRNLGMPYNSPSNEYLCAIDEENGVGWFASDRIKPYSGEWTIYLFIPNDVRKNREGDLEQLKSFAKISDYKQTWPEGTDYSDLIKEIKAIKQEKEKNANFTFAISGRGKLHYWSELKSVEGKNSMKEWLILNKSYISKYEELRQLRRKYATGEKYLAGSISKLETEVDILRKDVEKMASRICQYEAGYK